MECTTSKLRHGPVNSAPVSNREKFEWMINYFCRSYSVWPTDHKLGLFELPSRFISRWSIIWFTKTLLRSFIYGWRYLLCSMTHGTRNLLCTWHKSHRITPSSTRILSAELSLIMSYLFSYMTCVLFFHRIENIYKTNI